MGSAQRSRPARIARLRPQRQQPPLPLALGSFLRDTAIRARGAPCVQGPAVMARPAWMLTFTTAALGAALLVRAEAHAADSAAEAPSWTKAPSSAQARANPYGGNADAVRAGRKLVARHCASCHGEDGHGGRSAPPLDSVAVRRAADGDLF